MKIRVDLCSKCVMIPWFEIVKFFLQFNLLGVVDLCLTLNTDIKTPTMNYFISSELAFEI